MRIGSLSLFVPAVLAMSIFLLGCSSDSTGTSTEELGDAPSASAADADHDDHAGHDHGDEAGHEHPTEGPHGGHLIELGNEEYHAELLHDEDTHAVTIHLLDGPAKQTVSVPLDEITVQLFQDGQFVKYTLKAVPGQGDAAGAASQFDLVDAALCDALCQDEMSGRLQVTIDGKPYTGTIEHDSHEGHDHDDGHDHDGDGDDHDGDGHEGHEGDHEGHDHDDGHDH